MELVKNVFTMLQGLIAQLFELVGSILAKIIDWIAPVITMIGNFLSDVITVLGTIIGYIAKPLTPLINGIGKIITTFWNACKKSGAPSVMHCPRDLRQSGKSYRKSLKPSGICCKPLWMGLFPAIDALSWKHCWH